MEWFSEDTGKTALFPHEILLEIGSLYHWSWDILRKCNTKLWQDLNKMYPDPYEIFTVSKKSYSVDIIDIIWYTEELRVIKQIIIYRSYCEVFISYRDGRHYHYSVIRPIFQFPLCEMMFRGQYQYIVKECRKKMDMSFYLKLRTMDGIKKRIRGREIARLISQILQLEYDKVELTMRSNLID